MTFPKVVLAIDSAAFVLFGLAFVLLPDTVGRFVTGSAFASPAALTDARAIYGGMALGVGSCFWLAIRGGRDVQRVGLIGSAFTFGLIALARLIGIIIDGAGGAMMYVLLASEILGTLLSIWALRSFSRSTPA